MTERQYAFVTGGGKGIGRTIAYELAKNGYDVAICGRDLAALQSTAHVIKTETSGDCLLLQADLTDPESVEEAAATLLRIWGPPHALVAAAGVRDTSILPFAERDPISFESLFVANVGMTTMPVRALLPAMLEKRNGRIIVITGVFGFRAQAGRSATVASKWAIEGLVRSLAIEAGPAGITVNAICPGHVDGPRLESSLAVASERSGEPVEVHRSRLERQTVLGRLTTADEIAAAVLFLAGTGARSITGQDIVIDAGWSLSN